MLIRLCGYRTEFLISVEFQVIFPELLISKDVLGLRVIAGATLPHHSHSLELEYQVAIQVVCLWVFQNLFQHTLTAHNLQL
jgi:hypothetical protein